MQILEVGQVISFDKSSPGLILTLSRFLPVQLLYRICLRSMCTDITWVISAHTDQINHGDHVEITYSRAWRCDNETQSNNPWW